MGKLRDIKFGNDILDMISKAHTTKEEMNNLTYIKIKNVVHRKILSTK